MIFLIIFDRAASNIRFLMIESLTELNKIITFLRSKDTIVSFINVIFLIVLIINLPIIIFFYLFNFHVVIIKKN